MGETDQRAQRVLVVRRVLMLIGTVGSLLMAGVMAALGGRSTLGALLAVVFLVLAAWYWSQA